MSASLPTSTSSWMHLQKIVGHTQKSLLFSQPISIRVHPKSLTGMPYAHSLHGHPHPASRTLSMSPPGMGLLHIPRITSKSTLSLAILFSTFPDAVKLLQQTPSSLTRLLLMMVPPWPNSSVAMISQSGEDEDNPIPMANIDIPNLLGRSFLLPPEGNGECHMAKIIDIDDHGQTLEDIKFKLKINKDQAEEIMSDNQLMDYIQKGTDAEEDPDSLFKFRDIVAHQGPLESTDPNDKGSKYNVMVEWESGEVTYEPLTLISKDDTITCAVYAKKHDLLDTTGWKHLKGYA